VDGAVASILLVQDDPHALPLVDASPSARLRTALSLPEDLSDVAVAIVFYDRGLDALSPPLEPGIQVVQREDGRPAPPEEGQVGIYVLEAEPELHFERQDALPEAFDKLHFRGFDPTACAAQAIAIPDPYEVRLTAMARSGERSVLASKRAGPGFVEIVRTESGTSTRAVPMLDGVEAYAAHWDGARIWLLERGGSLTRLDSGGSMRTIPFDIPAFDPVRLTSSEGGTTLFAVTTTGTVAVIRPDDLSPQWFLRGGPTPRSNVALDWSIGPLDDRTAMLAVPDEELSRIVLDTTGSSFEFQPEDQIPMSSRSYVIPRYAVVHRFLPTLWRWDRGTWTNLFPFAEGVIGGIRAFEPWTVIHDGMTVTRLFAFATNNGSGGVVGFTEIDGALDSTCIEQFEQIGDSGIFRLVRLSDTLMFAAGGLGAEQWWFER
jgi:hypothetical protein